MLQGSKCSGVAETRSISYSVIRSYFKQSHGDLQNFNGMVFSFSLPISGVV